MPTTISTRSSTQEKFERWLKGDDARRLIVVAYDDREITLNGKKVSGQPAAPTGQPAACATPWAKCFRSPDATNPPFQETSGLDGRIHFFVHPNPQNKILHTVLVGEMNGLVQRRDAGHTERRKVGQIRWAAGVHKMGATRADAGRNLPNRSQPLPQGSRDTSAERCREDNRASPCQRNGNRNCRARPKAAIGGSEFMKSLQGLRIDKIVKPQSCAKYSPATFRFLAEFKTVPIVGTMKTAAKEVSATLEVMPDYVASAATPILFACR